MGLIIDLFAGGGGASTGIELATGRHIDIAINHDPDAIQLHKANHPHTRHFCSDVFEVDPLTATQGQPVDLLWASPDCKHFSKAKGGKPVSKKIRSLAWVVIKWASAVKPRMIFLENVEEFQTWGPLGDDQKPCPQRKGQTFTLWIEHLRKLGYAIEWKELRACDFGAPTIRKRLFLIARCDGLPIQWPQATHADPQNAAARGMLPWRTAAECIEWSLPCPSIFERDKPLAENTLRRIARGIIKYVINSSQPFIVSCAHGEESPSGVKRWGNGAALVTAFLSTYYGAKTDDGDARGLDMAQPLKTQTTENRFALVSSHMIKLRGDNIGHSTAEPLHTITAGGNHIGEVRALLVKYYGNDKDGAELHGPMHTIPTHDRFGLITVMIASEPYVITDIGMRMLQPHELFKAQGFPDDYQIEQGANGKRLSKTAQVRLCGNSVCPPIAQALVEANYFVKQEEVAA